MTAKSNQRALEFIRELEESQRPHEDPAYLSWVRTLPCCACGLRGMTQAHHRTGYAKGKKAPDRETMPLCHPCHRDLHDLRGFFGVMDKAALRAWQRKMIRETQQLRGSEDGGDVPF